MSPLGFNPFDFDFAVDDDLDDLDDLDFRQFYGPKTMPFELETSSQFFYGFNNSLTGDFILPASNNVAPSASASTPLLAEEPFPSSSYSPILQALLNTSYSAGFLSH